MDLDEELLARIGAAKSHDPLINVEDFQIRAGKNGTVLINLKTTRAQLVYDDESDLHDFEELNLTLTKDSSDYSG